MTALAVLAMAGADPRINLLDFRLPPERAQDLRGTAALLNGLACGPFLADRAFDADRCATT